jgi:hypothetical protein
MRTKIRHFVGASLPQIQELSGWISSSEYASIVQCSLNPLFEGAWSSLRTGLLINSK